jgi:hypothetical protein
VSPEPESDEEELWIDRHLLPALRDPGLLPVVLVVAGHLVAFIVPTLLFAVRDQSVPSLLGLVLLAVLSAECVRFEWRLSRKPTLTRLIVGIWIVAFGTAWIADHYGVL